MIMTFYISIVVLCAILSLLQEILRMILLLILCAKFYSNFFQQNFFICQVIIFSYIFLDKQSAEYCTENKRIIIRQ